MQAALVNCNGTGISIMGEGGTKMPEGGGGVETASPSEPCTVCDGCDLVPEWSFPPFAEMSHRSADFDAINKSACEKVRKVL